MNSHFCNIVSLKHVTLNYVSSSSTGTCGHNCRLPYTVQPIYQIDKIARLYGFIFFSRNVRFLFCIKNGRFIY